MSEAHPLDLPDDRTTLGTGGPDLFAVYHTAFPGTALRFRTFSTLGCISTIGGTFSSLACVGCVTTSKF